jgi:hypothetical protein
MMDIEGKTLREFLDWVARERGVRIRFENPALEARAPSIVLHGSLDGMTLEQATETVFLTSGLTHRWDDRELVVGPAN